MNRYANIFVAAALVATLIVEEPIRAYALAPTTYFNFSAQDRENLAVELGYTPADCAAVYKGILQVAEAVARGEDLYARLALGEVAARGNKRFLKLARFMAPMNHRPATREAGMFHYADILFFGANGKSQVKRLVFFDQTMATEPFIQKSDVCSQIYDTPRGLQFILLREGDFTVVPKGILGYKKTISLGFLAIALFFPTLAVLLYTCQPDFFGALFQGLARDPSQLKTLIALSFTGIAGLGSTAILLYLLYDIYKTYRTGPDLRWHEWIITVFSTHLLAVAILMGSYGAVSWLPPAKLPGLESWSIPAIVVFLGLCQMAFFVMHEGIHWLTARMMNPLFLGRRLGWSIFLGGSLLTRLFPNVFYAVPHLGAAMQASARTLQGEIIMKSAPYIVMTAPGLYFMHSTDFPTTFYLLGFLLAGNILGAIHGRGDLMLIQSHFIENFWRDIRDGYTWHEAFAKQRRLFLRREIRTMFGRDVAVRVPVGVQGALQDIGMYHVLVEKPEKGEMKDMVYLLQTVFLLLFAEDRRFTLSPGDLDRLLERAQSLAGNFPQEKLKAFEKLVYGLMETIVQDRSMENTERLEKLKTIQKILVARPKLSGTALGRGLQQGLEELEPWVANKIRSDLSLDRAAAVSLGAAL